MALEISSEITDTKAIIRIEGEVDVSKLPLSFAMLWIPRSPMEQKKLKLILLR